MTRLLIHLNVKVKLKKVIRYNLGNMYLHGEGTKPDVKRAVELYTLSAEQGIAANGKGVEQSLTTAREWFQKATAQGHEGAIAALKQLDK